MQVLRENEAHLSAYGGLFDPPETVIENAQVLIEVDLDHADLPWRNYANAVLHWQEALWNAFPNLMRASGERITREMLELLRKPGTPGGEAEIAALARTFGLQAATFTGQAEDATLNPLPVDSEDSLPVLGLRQTDEGWGAVTTLGGAFNLAARRSPGPAGRTSGPGSRSFPRGWKSTSPPSAGGVAPSRRGRSRRAAGSAWRGRPRGTTTARSTAWRWC